VTRTQPFFLILLLAFGFFVLADCANTPAVHNEWARRRATPDLGAPPVREPRPRPRPGDIRVQGTPSTAAR